MTIACSKKGQEKSSGIITGYDISNCGCCGGYFIEIEDEKFRIWNDFEGDNIDLASEMFPLSVKITWKKLENSCASDLIEAIFIKKK